MYSIIIIIKILANIRLIGSERLEMAKGRSLRDKKLRSAINQSRNISPYRETADKAIYSEIRSIICLKWMRSSCQIVGKEELSKVPSIMTNLFENRMELDSTHWKSKYTLTWGKRVSILTLKANNRVWENLGQHMIFNKAFWSTFFFINI